MKIKINKRKLNYLRQKLRKIHFPSLRETSKGNCQRFSYLLMAEEPDFRLLGSLSEPGIFHGPGETVAFRGAVLVLRMLLGWGGPSF